MVGSWVVGVILCTPEPGILKLIVSAPEPAIHSPGVAPLAVSVLAAVIASLRVHTPSSAVVSPLEVTVRLAAETGGLKSNTPPTLKLLTI